MKIQYLAKSLLQDYKISYNDNTISCQEPFQDYKMSYMKKIFFHPSYNTKNFLMPNFQHTIFFH